MDLPFPTMSVAEIAGLPLHSLLEEDAHVFLWTINRFLPAAFGVLESWGIRYQFLMAWRKPNGPKPAGLPTYNLETILVGRRGRPKFLETKAFRTANCWDAPRNRSAAAGAWGRQIANCAKPEEFYELVSRVTPAPRLDMFARREIEGFDSWGLEAPMQWERSR